MSRAAFVGVDECNIFRDSAVILQSQILTAGGSAELHVWFGIYYGELDMKSSVPDSKTQKVAGTNFGKRMPG